MTTICKNIQEIKQDIAQRAVQAGRNPDTVQLLAVSKKKSVQAIEEAVSCGQVAFGENYVQEAVEKIPCCPHSLNWHFIGHLQSNKVKQVVQHFSTIQTVDRLKIAKAIHKHAEEQKKQIQIFVQINIGAEQQKSGLAPQDAESLLTLIREETNLYVAGLMTIPPYTANPEQTRGYFQEMGDLAQQLREKGLFSDNEHVELSMGMSNDYHIAIEEGATLIRVGTAIFGERL